MNNIYKVFFTLFLLLLPISSFASVSVTQNVSTVASCSVSSKTVSITTVSGDTLLLAIMSFHSFVSPVSMTFNGVAMTLGTSTSELATYYLKNPSIGTYNLVGTVSSAGGCVGIGASVLSGVDLNSVVSGYPNSDGTSPYSLAMPTPVSGSFWWTGGKNTAGATLTAGSGSYVGSQPEVSAFGTFFGYSDGTLSSTDPTYANYSASAGVLYGLPFIMQASSGGGGGSASTTISTSVVLPATLYSSKLIQNPVSTTTYSFASSIVNASSSLQSGLVFIVHSSTTTPSVVWSGSTMTALDTTDIASGYVISMYAVHSPSYGSIVVSGIVASSTLYISESVLDNASNWAAFDKHSVVSGSSIASVSLPTPTTPTGLFASFYTGTGLSSFSKLVTSNIAMSATSSLGDFTLLSSSCTSASDDCLIGYSKSFSLFDSSNGEVIGIAMYATSSVFSTSPPLLVSIAGGLGTDSGFAACLDDGFLGSITCLGKNMVFWTLGLFVPSNADMVSLRNTFYETVTASTSLTSTLFLVPVAFTMWTSTTSIPSYNKLEIYVPVFNKTWVLDPSPATTVDMNVYNMLSWMLGTAMVLFIGYKFWKLV